MPQPRSVFGSLVLIAVVLAGGAAAFAYTAGWFSPQRLTPKKIVNALAPPTGAALGHRRNHAWSAWRCAYATGHRRCRPACPSR